MNGTQLDAIRKAMGVTKDELATALDMSRPTLDVRLRDISLFTLAEIEIVCKLLKIEKAAILQD